MRLLWIEQTPYWISPGHSILYMFFSGNALVCIVIIKKRDMRTVTNLFLLNMALSDILSTVFAIPSLLAIEISPQYWPLGDFMCRATRVISTISVSVSIYTMVALALERYVRTKDVLMTGKIMLALLRKMCLKSFDRDVKPLPPINVLVVIFFYHTIVTRGTGYEPLQVSKSITKVPQFMLKALRPCTIFCSHYGWIT